MTFFTLIGILFLRYFHFWDKSLLKDSLFWYFSFGVITFFNITNAKGHIFFISILKETFKWTILLEFIVNFYTFSLITEMLLIPIIVTIAIIQIAAEFDKKNEGVKSFTKNILNIIGFIYFSYAFYKTINEYQTLFTLHNLNAFILPILLSVYIIPFFYFLAVYICYEEFFIKIKFISNNIEKKNLKKEIFYLAKLNLNKISTIKQNLNKSDLYHAEDIKAYLKSLV